MARRLPGKIGINTRLAHGGYEPQRLFRLRQSARRACLDRAVSRCGNDVVERAEIHLRHTRHADHRRAGAGRSNELEGSAGTILVPSGLAAVTIPLLAFLSAGDHVLIVDSVYFPTRHFANTMLKRLGVEVEYYDPHVGAGISALMKPNTKVVLTESPGSEHVRDAGHSGDRQGGACRRRGRHDGQHLGDAALFPAARLRRRHLDPRRDEISGRSFGRAARHGLGQ